MDEVLLNHPLCRCSKQDKIGPSGKHRDDKAEVTKTASTSYAQKAIVYNCITLQAASDIVSTCYATT